MRGSGRKVRGGLGRCGHRAGHGAVQMAYEVSRQLGVLNFFAEREDGVMTLRRGFAVHPGQRVLVVEDVVTTGARSAR